MRQKARDTKSQQERQRKTEASNLEIERDGARVRQKARQRYRELDRETKS